MKWRFLLFGLLAGLTTAPGHAQRLEGRSWYFGIFKSIVFEKGQVHFNPQSAAYSNGPSMTLSDSSGQLLFYGSENRVYNRYHQRYSQDIRCSQSLITYPISDSVAGVFSTDDYQGKLRLVFSKIYHQRNMGRGAIEYPSPIVNKSMAQPLALAKRKDSAGYYLVTHLNASDSFCIIKTGSGASFVRYQKIGPVYNIQQNTVNHEVLKAAPNSKYLYTIKSHREPFLDLYKFNDSTGQLYDWIRINMGHNGSGASVSSDARYIYYMSLKRIIPPLDSFRYYIYKMDLASWNPAVILNTRIAIDSFTRFGSPISSQLAIDGNIYLMDPGSRYVGRIKCVNSPGNSSRFEDKVLDFQANHPTATGLPTLNQTLFVNANKLQITPTKRRLCIGDTSILQAYGATIDVFNWAGPPGLDSVNRASPRFIATAPGFYTFTVTGTSACTTASASVTIEVLNVSSIKSTTQETWSLEQNRPNPFNNATSIRYATPASATNIRMLVVDRTGTILKTVKNLEAGSHELTFNRGELPAGLYLYKIVGDQGASQTKEFIIE